MVLLVVLCSNFVSYTFIHDYLYYINTKDDEAEITRLYDSERIEDEQCIANKPPRAKTKGIKKEYVK